MRVPNRKKQSGAVIILLFVVLIISVTTVMLAGLSNRSPQLKAQLEKQAEMQRIKETLLGYAMTFPDYATSNAGPGRLPCPDTDNDGVMQCNSSRTVGRLPVSVGAPIVTSPVQLSDRYQGIDQQYWLAASLDFQQNITSLNSGSVTRLLSLNGVTNYAALIIAPNAILDGQIRNGDSQIGRYLESTESDTSTTFLSVNPTDPIFFNDIIVPITVSEVMSLTTVRVTQEMKRVLDYSHANDGGNRYPLDPTEFITAMSAPAATVATWINANAWIGAASYTYVSDNEATISYSSCAIIYTLRFTESTITRSPLAC